jgi:hypothetical protein
MIDIIEIIPPSDREHRDGFTNEPLIDILTDSEKRQLEDILIDMLLNKQNKWIDTLIVETLGYLKSEKSIPVLKNLFNSCTYEMCNLIIATSIFEISNDSSMINRAIDSIKKMDNKNDPYYIYDLSSAFYYLAKFKRPETEMILESYTEHNEMLVSYNAKRHLGILPE